MRHLIILIAIFAFAAAVGAGEWTAELTVSFGSDLQSSTVMTLGTRSGATELFDAGIDVAMPPPPPTGSQPALKINDTRPGMNMLWSDFRDTTAAPGQFVLVVQNFMEDSVIVTWNGAILPMGMLFYYATATSHDTSDWNEMRLADRQVLINPQKLVIRVTPVSGVEPVASLGRQTWSLYPNPFSDELTLYSQSITRTLRLYDLEGRMLRAWENLPAGTVRILTPEDQSILPNGMLFLVPDDEVPLPILHLTNQ